MSLLVTGFTGTLSASAAEVFSDISDAKYAWAKDYIVEMAQEGYIAGYEDNTYRPDNKVTRLETIVLFSRAMGANRQENVDVLEIAVDKYGDTVDKLGLNFGDEEVAFMLYRGALDEEDLSLYLSKDKASNPMPRQEAAAIITKAMCAEEAALSEVLVDLEYTDVKQIDSEYTQYVFYVSEKGIMNGMDDGSFSPASSVLRSQIAVMLHRTVDKMNLYIETAVIKELDTEKNNISIMDADGMEVKMGYTNFTKFYVDNETAKEEDVYTNAEARLTYVDDKLAFVDVFEKVIDETLKGIYQGSSTVNGKTTVTIKEAGTNETVDYNLSAQAVFENEDGTKAAFSGFKPGEYVKYDIAYGTIIKFAKLNKDSRISNAVIKEIGIDKEMYIIISHNDEEYDGQKYILTDDVDVFKNNDREDLSKLYKGDRIDITFEYGAVTKIVAASDIKYLEGTVSEVVISSTPVLKAKINGEIREFDILVDTKIVISGEAATVYDLRYGDTIKITTESGAVLKIETTAPAATSGRVEGVVELINKSRGFIIISGQTVYCSDAATTFITSKGSDKMMKDIKEGMTVETRGTMSNGAYTASLIIIEE